MITVKAYAKLNLYLDITGKRDDGYHNIESVMQSIDLYDEITLSITKCDRNVIRIICDDPIIPTNESNIAYRAADIFLRTMNSAESYRITVDIKKKIPVEGGLGGSSTDGAAVLTALNNHFGSFFDTAVLREIGERLGADLPFCITGGTCVCTGIGGSVQKLPFADEYFVVVKPDFSFNSGDGYKRYDENPTSKDPNFKKLTDAVIKKLPYHKFMYNVFESIYGDIRITELKSSLIEAGAQGALMTGSGSAVFGVFDAHESAERAAEKLSKRSGLSIFCVKST